MTDNRFSMPSRDDILAFLKDNPGQGAKRDIARAFKLKGAQRVELKRMLREMEDEGVLKKRGKRSLPKGVLPPVAVLVAGAPDEDGDIFAIPEHWEGGEGETPPRILVARVKKGEEFGEGDRILARLEETPEAEDHDYRAKIIKKIGAGPATMIGIYRSTRSGAGRLVPVSKKSDKEWLIPEGFGGNAADGELVECEALPTPKRAYGPKPAKVTKVLGDPLAPRSVSLIAIEEHGIPTDWPQAALDEAEGAQPVGLGAREDLRDLPLLTIDPHDARDHDDAVCALPDEDPENEGGWVVWVAIADVAHYVRPGSALDREAKKRGNSSYFPDRVVPMLPEALSGDLCSLHEGVDRPCMAVRMVLDAEGNKISHRFTRGLMNSPASLAYEDAQSADDGAPSEKALLHLPALADLFAAWRCADGARSRRQPLSLDLPERKVELTPEGEVAAVRFRDRLDAHKLIEEFMILANVCAAETLQKARIPLVYRVHEEPGIDKVDALREQAESVGLALARGQVVTTAQFNRLLDQAAGTDFAEFINISVLRAQTQAYYGCDPLGHFGLNLKLYAHFTSPIRRYADLIVHRALIAAHEGGAPDGPRAEDEQMLRETAQHISFTERRSMNAERDTIDRYLAAFLRDRVGAEFQGRVAGVARFGLFVKLDETGADGLIPIGSLGNEYWHHDPDQQLLIGDRTGTRIGLGQRCMVKLLEAVPVTGGLLFEMLELEGAPGSPRGGGGPDAGRRRRGSAPRRTVSKGRIAKAKASRGKRRG